MRADGEPGGGDGAARAVAEAELAGDLADYPQSVAVVSRPQLCAAGCAVGCVLLAPVVRRAVVRRAVVADLAVQERGVGPQAQPPVPGAVPYRVGGQLVRGSHDLIDPGLAQPGRRGVRRDRGSQHIQDPPSKA